MNGQAVFVVCVLALLILALMKDRMRPGMILLTGAVIFLCAGSLHRRKCSKAFPTKG